MESLRKFKLITRQLLNLQGGDSIPVLLNYILQQVETRRPKMFLEGFGGSGIVSINVANNFGNVQVVWNDIDINLYAALFCVKTNLNNIIERVDLMYRHLRKDLSAYRDVLEDVKDCLRNRTDLDLYSRGFWTIILYNTCVVCWNTKNMLRPRGKTSLKPTLELWHKLLQRIELSNRNFFNIWHMYNRSDAFMYLDPPHYTQQTLRYGRYRHLFTLRDIEQLVDILTNTNANTLLKISADELKHYKKLLQHGYKQENINYQSHTNRKHTVKLIFLKNF